MVIYGQERIRKISKKLDLPLWWIKSLAIECLPCRRFAEGGNLWIFDFEILDENLIDQIRLERVVILHYTLFQKNLDKNVHGYRRH